MFVYIVAEPGKENKVANKIKTDNLGKITAFNSNEIVVKIDKQPTTKSALTRLENKFKKIPGILRTESITQYLKVADVSLKEALRTNRCAFFFDIDSTLTRGGPGTIHHKIENIFQKMNEKGIPLFFATGRSMPDLAQLLKGYPVEKFGIAENGGLILGFGPDGYTEFGSKKEPSKIQNYVCAKYGTPEDMKQGFRLTEVIFLQKDITLKKLESARKNTRANVDFHPSKNSYHISHKGINKGTAMLELCKKLHFNNRMIIAVGDADMDIPMLTNANYSYAVGNSSSGAKKAAKKVLKGKFEKGIEEIFDLIKRV